MPVVRRQRVQQTAHLVGSPVMRDIHRGTILLDELCQKDRLSPDGLRVEATADPAKMADFYSNSANPGTFQKLDQRTASEPRQTGRNTASVRPSAR